MKHKKLKIWTLAALLLLVVSVVFGCDQLTDQPKPGYEHIAAIEIQGGDEIYLQKGYTMQLKTDIPQELENELTWTTHGDIVSLTSYGYIVAKNEGTTRVTVAWRDFQDTIIIVVGSEMAPLPSETDTDGAGFDETDSDETYPDGNHPSDTQPDHPPVVESQPSDTQPSETRPSDQKPDETEPETEIQLPAVDQQARDQFYNGADPADSHQEALERSARGELSGATTVPDQAPILSAYMPMMDGLYIRNNEPYYVDENTYVVVNAYGQEVFRVYRGGGYITLEEVAAYVYAFGEVPANYSANKKDKPTQSIWGEYLRVNNTAFSGNTSKYPYEPVLPRISGCGGDLYYYEIDIGTTGTDCDPSYTAALYNNGTKITRGAARIVYTRYDANHNNIIDPNEKFLFYTYNHYNDFQEYLNYYGGWGEMFGNITGGGTISSKYDYNPTPYVPVVMASLRTTRTVQAEVCSATVLWYDFRSVSGMAWDKSRFAA